MEFLIKLNNITDINILLPLLSRLGISFTEKTNAKTIEQQKKSIPITYATKPDFMALAGIWKDKNITSEQLRHDAWGDRL
jgi:hypothetical protein